MLILMKQYLLLFLPWLLLAQSPYKKIIHNLDPEAKCLDGSSSALYLYEGDPRKILFYFEGGASCADLSLAATLQNCYQRSKTFLGSSLYWPQNLDGQGILSNDPEASLFSNWTKLIFPYCDGAFHQGKNNKAIKYKDGQLYFRGGAITRSHFKYADKLFNLSSAEKIILTGSSAGGMATYAWTDYLRSSLSNPEVLYTVPDSGIFLSPQSSNKNHLQQLNQPQPMEILFTLSNIDETVPNKKCSSAVGKVNQWSCLNIQIAYPFIESKLLFIQSNYDSYVIRYGGNIKCLTQGISGYSLANCGNQQINVIEGYRQYYLTFLNKIRERNHSVWSISCSWHAVIQFKSYYDSPLQQVPANSGYTMRRAVEDYVLKDLDIWAVDQEPWPSNFECAY